MRDDIADKLERMIDSDGLAEVVAAIGRVCSEKGDHLRSNWQDENTAKVWERAGKLTDKAYAAIVKLGLP